jgi:hypothetical protein
LFTGFGDITLGEVNVLDAQGDPLDGFDLSLRGNNLFLTAIIPEPGTWTLLLTGAALLALLRRRR